MSLLNHNRNDIRHNNSDAKCLLENWVEEREVQDIDNEKAEDFASRAQMYKDGHKKILSFGVDVKKETTTADAYRPPVKCNVRQIGKKQELMELMLLEQFCNEANEESNELPPMETGISTMSSDYNKPDFVSVKPPPTTTHNYKTEQPVTFWSEHRNRAAGVSQVKTRDSAFRKNHSFSTPIQEYWDQPKPFELEVHPKM